MCLHTNSGDNTAGIYQTDHSDHLTEQLLYVMQLYHTLLDSITWYFCWTDLCLEMSVHENQFILRDWH